MLYYILKPILLIFYRVFYRIQYRDIKNIPLGKPVFLAPNHVNAFVDPTVIAMLVKQKVRFLARGDVFKGGIVGWALESVNISPMFRMEEGGLSEVKKNNKTIEDCIERLGRNETLLMFPEAICVQEKRLRKLRKGLARIIFLTEEAWDYKKDVLVVPVGLNYSDAKAFRSKLVIDFGEPISLKDFTEKYKIDKAKTINDFNNYLFSKMSELLVVIEKKENEKLCEGLFEIYTKEVLAKENQSKNLIRENDLNKEVGNIINHFENNAPEKIISLRNLVEAYTDELNKLKLRDHLLQEEAINKINSWSFLKDFVIIWFGMPIYWIGLLMNYPPYLLAKNMTAKKIKQDEFKASFYANLAWIFWMIYYALQLLIVALVFRNWNYLGIYALLVPIMMMYVLRFYPTMKKIFGKWRLLDLVKKEKEKAQQIIFARKNILVAFEKLKKEYKAN